MSQAGGWEPDPRPEERWGWRKPSSPPLHCLGTTLFSSMHANVACHFPEQVGNLCACEYQAVATTPNRAGGVNKFWLNRFRWVLWNVQWQLLFSASARAGFPKAVKKLPTFPRLVVEWACMGCVSFGSPTTNLPSFHHLHTNALPSSKAPPSNMTSKPSPMVGGQTGRRVPGGHAHIIIHVVWQWRRASS